MLKCYFCPETEEDSRLSFEWHHINGRKFSPEKVPVCPNCHRKVTTYQNKSAPKVRAQRTRKDLLLETAQTHYATMILVGKNGLRIVEELRGMMKDDP